MQSPEVVSGHTRTPSLTIDMAALFETFVRTAMREALGADEHRFPAGRHCPPLHLDAHRSVRLEPDLSYWTGDRCTFVGDVKYKRDTGPGHNGDLYQLLAYATATGLPEATLVYAFGPTSPRTHTVPGAGLRLRVEHLNLSRPPADLLQQVRDLTRRLGASPAAALG
jgi:5-methylcytosine-specific restriction enzyme subunit McrC